MTTESQFVNQPLWPLRVDSLDLRSAQSCCALARGQCEQHDAYVCMARYGPSHDVYEQVPVHLPVQQHQLLLTIELVRRLKAQGVGGVT